MNNPRITPKERGLIKGALRRVFSRSELRRKLLASITQVYTDPKRPRVKKWSICPVCESTTPTYLMVVDHVLPIVPINKSLDEMEWNELIDALWCDEKNLMPMCKPCHQKKTKAENKLRREHKKHKEGVKNGKPKKCKAA